MLAKSLETLIKKLTFIKTKKLQYTNYFKNNLSHGYFSKIFAIFKTTTFQNTKNDCA